MCGRKSLLNRGGKFMSISTELDEFGWPVEFNGQLGSWSVETCRSMLLSDGKDFFESYFFDKELADSVVHFLLDK